MTAFQHSGSVCSIDECGFSRICLPAYIKDSHISLDLLLHDMIYLLVAAATSSPLLAHQKLHVNALTASNHPQIIPVGLFSINKVSFDGFMAVIILKPATQTDQYLLAFVIREHSQQG